MVDVEPGAVADSAYSSHSTKSWPFGSPRSICEKEDRVREGAAREREKGLKEENERKESVRERERQRQSERERETERQKEAERQRQHQKQNHRNTETQNHRNTETQNHRTTETQNYRNTETQNGGVRGGEGRRPVLPVLDDGPCLRQLCLCMPALAPQHMF
eukprot:3917667-Rhodomonas_salina.1